MNTFNNIDIVIVEDFLESIMKESDDSNCIDIDEAMTEQKSSFHEDNSYKFYDKNSIIINIPSIRLDGTILHISINVMQHHKCYTNLICLFD